MIKVENLCKKFDSFQILDNINIQVKKGSIYALVGTNGAGKTTLIKHLTGVLKPDSGIITIDGVSVFEEEEIKAKIGYIADNLYFFNTYNLKEMARFLKGVYLNWNQDRYDKMANMFKLDSSKKLSRFSRGMQKQAAFVLTMSTMPEYLILDEPIDGLDPIVRRQIWKYIVDDVSQRQMTVLISSHNLREIENLCDCVGIISNGKTVIEQNLDDLKSNVHKVQVAYANEPTDPFAGLNVLHADKQGSVHLLILKDKREVVEEVLNKGNPAILDILPLSLEEIFIYELGGSENEEVLF
ncbi:MAG: ABC transporter ATP-binding protein [Anaerovoracaceae bacterium]